MQLRVRQIERCVRAQFGACADTLQNLETQVRAERCFDHLIVALADTRRGNFGSAQQLVLDVDGCFSSHLASLTVILLSVKDERKGGCAQDGIAGEPGSRCRSLIRPGGRLSTFRVTPSSA